MKWEYKCVHFYVKGEGRGEQTTKVRLHWEQYLNEQGALGWEIVQWNYEFYAKKIEIIYYLKRQVS